MPRSSIGLQCASLSIQEHDGSPSGISVPAGIAGRFGCGFRRAFLEYASYSGECLPVDQQPEPSVAQPDRQGQREPKTQAADAVLEPARGARAGLTNCPCHRIPAPIRAPQPVSYWPDRKFGKENAPDGVAFVHLDRAPIRKEKADEPTLRIPPHLPWTYDFRLRSLFAEGREHDRLCRGAQRCIALRGTERQNPKSSNDE
jgi:hypothetical protein